MTTHTCDTCNKDCGSYFNAEQFEMFEEYQCKSCEENANEAAYESSMSDYYGGGYVSLSETMANARKVK